MSGRSYPEEPRSPKFSQKPGQTSPLRQKQLKDGVPILTSLGFAKDRADKKATASRPAPPTEQSSPIEIDKDLGAKPARTHEEMSKPVLFYGKPSQLEDVLTYVQIQNLGVQSLSDQDRIRTLVGTFRGEALSWLTSEIKSNSQLLERDYDGLLDKVRSTFEPSERVQTATAARQFANIVQKTTVQLYATRLKQLAKLLGINDATAQAQFVKGLKPHIQRALAISGRDDGDDLDEVIREATRLDEELYSSSANRGPARGGGKRNFTTQGSSGKTGKCHNCGQFGHKAAQCKTRIKKEQDPW